MEDDRGFFGWIWAFLTSPFNQYDYSTGEQDWALSIMLWLAVFLIVTVAVSPFVAVAVWGTRRLKWHMLREHCQHKECGGQWTTRTSSYSQVGCLSHQPCCDDCAYCHLKDAALRRAEEEPRYDCVHGHGRMKKEVVDVLDGTFIVLGVCEAAACHGIWFSGDELEKLKEHVRLQGYNAGQDSGFATGLALGVAAG